MGLLALAKMVRLLCQQQALQGIYLKPHAAIRRIMELHFSLAGGWIGSQTRTQPILLKISNIQF